MRTFMIQLVFLFFSSLVYSQNKNEDTLNTNKYFKYAGNVLVDIRQATQAQLKLIAVKERLTAIYQDGYLFSVGQNMHNSLMPLAVRFNQDSNSRVYEGKSPGGVTPLTRTLVIDGIASVDFASVAITKENAKDYRYHIVSNFNKEIVGWSIPDNFKTTSNGKTSYAYLGSFDHLPGQVLLIEIYNTKNYEERDALIIDWRQIKPVKISVGIESTRKRIAGGPYHNSLDSLKDRKRENFIETTNYDDKKFHLSDSLVRLRISLNKDNGAFSNYNFKVKKTIKGKTTIINLGDYKNWTYLYKEFWKEPGVYEFIFTPQLPSPGGSPIKYLPNKAVSYKFTVLPSKNQYFLITYKEIWLSIISIFILTVFIIWFFALKNRMKLFAEKQKKDFALLKLKSVRAQLNPHFMFNALAGIQNLINKNDIDTANRYLGKFARLTRNVLDEKNNDLISLADEKTLLDDYLQMEQLRFGFKYNITVHHEIDAINTQIPSMLLQPFIENSIKHGVAELKNNGNIDINIFRIQKDVILTVKDNGSGYNIKEEHLGLGLKLSENRISLLNSLYKGAPIKLKTDSSNQGVLVTILLKDWL